MPEKSRFVATQEQLAIHARISYDRDQAVIQRGFKWADLKTFRDYANGKHNVVLTEKQQDILRNMIGNKFCDNVCHQIVGEATGRIEFVEWECPKNETVQEWLKTFFRTAKVKNRQGDVHYRSLRDGNFALAINWDSKRQRVSLYKEDWWDGATGTFIHYDEADEPEYAVKEYQYIKRINNGEKFVDQKVKRRVVWFEDQIQRWENTVEGADTGWYPTPLESDLIPGENPDELVQAWPLPWLDSNGDPLGIPYVHFPNVGKTYGNYGVSELDGGVIGFQDQLNDAQYNMSINVRFTGAQQYYGTGIKLANKAGTSEPLPVKMEPGMMHTSPDPNSRFGVLPAGDPKSIIASYDLKLKSVARMTRTPLHSITGGDWPSGDALLRAEIPAVNKARKQISQYEDCWVEVATLAMKIYNTFKKGSDPTINYDISKGMISAKFEDPEKRDAISRSIIVHNLAGTISIKEALRIMDYPDDKVDDIYEEKMEEDVASAQVISDTLATRSVPGSGGGGKGAAGSGGSNKKDSRPT